MADDLILELSRAVDSLRDDSARFEPVWTPLEALVPYDWCGGFMFMEGRLARVILDHQLMIPAPEKRAVWSYKHGITRQYLHIGADLNVYRYLGGEAGDPVYERIDVDTALKRVYDDIARFGATTETRYDTTYIAERNQRLVAAGFTVIG